MRHGVNLNCRDKTILFWTIVKTVNEIEVTSFLSQFDKVHYLGLGEIMVFEEGVAFLESEFDTESNFLGFREIMMVKKIKSVQIPHKLVDPNDVHIVCSLGPKT